MRFRPKHTEYGWVNVHPSKNVKGCIYLDIMGGHLTPAEARRVAAELLKLAAKLEKK